MAALGCAWRLSLGTGSRSVGASFSRSLVLRRFASTATGPGLLPAGACLAALIDNLSLAPSQPGISLQPNSPSPSLSCRVSSVKPLPIHNCPLNPLAASGGPNAAGRAAKKVLLSSVRLMVALGGKSEKGLVENSERNCPFSGGRDDDDDDDVAEGCERPIEPMERNTRKRDAEQKSTRIAIRGGRIVRGRCRHAAAGDS